MDLSYTNDKLFKKMFGVYVRESRELRRLDLAALSRLTGFSVKKLRGIEAGTASCRGDTIVRLSAVLSLQESQLERMIQVARTRYIDEFMSLVWEQSEMVEV